MPKPWNPNLDILESAADRLRPLLDQFVFVGGCAAGLLITDPAAPGIRATKDVDVVVQAGTWIEYERFNRRLPELGLQEDPTDGAPVCRWRGDGFVLDALPASAEVLGFGSEWHETVLASAEPYTLPSGTNINVVDAPGFLATKLAAFVSRGERDFMASHDMEDLVAVLDGRPTIIEEIRDAKTYLRRHLATEFRRLLDNDRFREALHGHVPMDSSSPDRIALVTDRIESIADLE